MALTVGVLAMAAAVPLALGLGGCTGGDDAVPESVANARFSMVCFAGG